MGHIDVVPVVNKESWEAPPFSAEIKDGFIYGRGTIDNKDTVFVRLVTSLEQVFLFCQNQNSGNDFLSAGLRTKVQSCLKLDGHERPRTENPYQSLVF